jgi:hypothetical protein
MKKIHAVVLAGDNNTIPLYPGHKPGPKGLYKLDSSQNRQMIRSDRRDCRFV